MKLASAILTLLENEQTFIATDAVANQAKKAIEYKQKYKDEVKGGTQVGWTRASQLANKQKISYDTIKRMYSFFSRHDGNQTIKAEYKDTPWKDNGYIAWLIWGGDAGHNWVKSIIDKNENNHHISEKIEGLENKAKESGISYSILKQVYDRGMGAYETNPQSVRPNVTSPQQWAMARVNSFISGGKTRTTADKDLWDKHKGKK